jgi:two-component system chemotaxis sensor kinase CheA
MREVGSTRAEIAQMRQATLSAVLDTARDSILALAQREQRRLRVLVRGRDVPVDRRLAEALVDPVLQLGRNAVAHGIERPEDRLAAGKPATGTIALVAERRGAHLLIAVRDDGAGVDVEALRRRAIQAGVWTQQGAGAPEDEALTHLLFLPGLTTRQAPDMLSGRGVGLDLTRGMVRRLGGTVRVRSRRGRGFEAIIDVPLQERGMVPIVIVGSRGHRFALSARRVLRVRELASEDAAHTPALASFVGTPAAGTDVPRLAIDVGRTEVEEAPVAFAIERVQGVEMAMVRPVPPLVAAAGPYGGLVSASDGEPALLLDVLLLADRVRAREPGGSRTPAPPAVDLGRGRDRGAWP